MLNIKWEKVSGDLEFSPHWGFDEEGNQYYEAANKETCEVVLKDGRTGAGWTAEEAYKNAKSKGFYDYKYEIYQLGPNSDRFKRWESLPDHVDTVDLDAENYIDVYSSRIQGANEYNVLEKLYFIFNMQHPEGFKGHSLSVSDIIKLNDSYYFCQSAGFKKINVV